MLWFNDPAELISLDKLLIFWPSSHQTFDERINATSRFIIYSSTIVFAIRRDSRVIILALLILFAMFLYVKIKPIQGTPTTNNNSRDNPMGNILMNEYVENPERSATVYDSIITDKHMNQIFPVNQRWAERQFYTMPSTTIPNDQDAFLDFAYGGKGSMNCKAGGACNLETNTRDFNGQMGLRRGGRIDEDSRYR
jgi:hypothetical protein